MTAAPAPGQSLRMPRGRRSYAASVTAILAVLFWAAVAIEAIWLAAYGRPILVSAATITSATRGTTYGATVMFAVGIVLAAVGLVLIGLAVLPARRQLLELDVPEPELAVGLTERSLSRTLAAAARDIDGVTGVRVTGRRRLTVTATTTLRNTNGIDDRVRGAVDARLDELTLDRRPAVRVRLRRKDR